MTSDLFFGINIRRRSEVKSRVGRVFRALVVDVPHRPKLIRTSSCLGLMSDGRLVTAWPAMEARGREGPPAIPPSSTSHR